MSKCAWCKDVCGKGQIDSHGICIHCLAKMSPNSPKAQRYFKAMEKGKAKMEKAGLHSVPYLSEIQKFDMEKKS